MRYREIKLMLNKPSEKIRNFRNCPCNGKNIFQMYGYTISKFHKIPDLNNCVNN